MSDPEPNDGQKAGAGEPRPKPKAPSLGRIAIWVLVGGVGIYLVVSGLIGVIVKGQ